MELTARSGSRASTTMIDPIATALPVRSLMGGATSSPSASVEAAVRQPLALAADTATFSPEALELLRASQEAPET